jgi:ketosteroid isomerase-like protein
MSNDSAGALAADREFFNALTHGDSEVLNRLLVDDFILIDVMRGGEVPKSALVALVGSGQLKFESIMLSDSRARLYGGLAIVIGRTEMRMRFEQTAATVHSRYTHVYVRDQDRWRMVSAQGTQIVDEPR